MSTDETRSQDPFTFPFNYFKFLSDEEKQLLNCLYREISEIVKDVIGHGINHHLATSRYAYTLSLADGKGRHNFLAALCGIIHDLRWWDDKERKARKLKIDKIEGVPSPVDILDGLLEQKIITADERSTCALVISAHSDLPTEQAPALLKYLRGGDRLSRFGVEGLKLLFELNYHYHLSGNNTPFYIEGGKISWNRDDGIIPNSEIKSCVDDVRACLSWILIAETPAETVLMNQLEEPLVEFLRVFHWHQINSYEFWLEKIDNEIFIQMLT